MKPPSLAVVGHAENFLRARDLISATRLACGNQVPVIVYLPEEEVADLIESRWTEALVTFIPTGTSTRAVIDEIGAEFVLCMPRIHLFALSGVMPALDFLKDSPEIAEIAGLIHSRHRAVYSGAFRVLHVDEEGGQSVGPIEHPALAWKKRGLAATADADLLGGVSLVRREHLADYHLHDGSLTARALSRVGAPTGGDTQVFSGLHAFCLNSTLSLVPSSGLAEFLSEDAFDRWKSAGVREVTVLHRGVGVLDEIRGVVVFCSDERIAQVDGRGEIAPGDISYYYHPVSTEIQLGQAFTIATKWHVAAGGRPEGNDDFRGSIEGLTPAERAILRIIRTLGARLPGPVITVIKRTLSRLGRRS